MRFSPGCNCCGADPGPVVGHASFNVSGECLRGAAHPALSVWTTQEGSPDPINTIHQITFGGTITGGTFTLENLPGFQVTGSITWSSDPATLAAAIAAALIATSSFGPADIVVTARDAAHYEVEFTGVRAGTNVSTMTYTSSLAGTSPTIAIATVQVGAAGEDEHQQLVLPYPPNGGTLKLEFDGQTTASISWHATPATFASNIDSALEALSNIPAGGVSVGTDLTIRFTGGLQFTDVPEMTVAENLLTASPVDAKRIPIPGAAVTLYKDGVEESAGTTDADGNVRLPIYHPGTGFTVGVAATGYHPGVNAVASYGAQAAGTLTWGRNGGVRVELERPTLVPLIIEASYSGAEPGHLPGDPMVGASVSLVGDAGTYADGFSASGSTDSGGEYRVLAPSESPYDSLGSTIDYVIDHPDLDTPVTGTLDMAPASGGVCGIRSGGGDVLPDDWPE